MRISRSEGLRPGANIFATDVCVPISRLADCVMETKADLAELRLIAPIVGHAGDGNFHLSVLVDTNDPVEMRASEELVTRLAKRAIAMDGTCTGEHGIGQGKMLYLEEELGPGDRCHAHDQEGNRSPWHHESG